MTRELRPHLPVYWASPLFRTGGAEVRWIDGTDVYGRGLYSWDKLPAGRRGEWRLSHSCLQVLPWDTRVGIKRQWKSRVCCAWVRRRRWEDAAGSRAVLGPKVRENILLHIVLDDVQQTNCPYWGDVTTVLLFYFFLNLKQLFGLKAA